MSSFSRWTWLPPPTRARPDARPAAPAPERRPEEREEQRPRGAPRAQNQLPVPPPRPAAPAKRRRRSKAAPVAAPPPPPRLATVLPPRDAAPTAPREASAEPGVAGLAAYIVTCHERRPALEATLARFRRTDWGRDPKLITDDGTGPDRRARVHATWQKALERVARGTADLALIMEDDLDFNRHLRHNLTAWVPLRGRDGAAPFFASIYDVGAGGAPGAPQASGDHYRIASPTLAWGGHAIIVSRFMAGHFVRYWGEEDGTADIRMPRLAARLTVILLHTPSLVQHIGDDSAWCGLHHRTADFDRDWRAAPALASSLPARAGAGAGRD